MLTLMLEYFLFSLLTTSQDQMVFRHKTIMGFGLEAKLEFLGCILASGSVFGCIMHLFFVCRPLNGIRSSLLTFLHSLGRRIVGWRGNLHHSYAPVNTCNCFIFMFNFACKSFWLYYASSTLKQNLAKSSKSKKMNQNLKMERKLMSISYELSSTKKDVIHSIFLPFVGFLYREVRRISLCWRYKDDLMIQ